MSRPPRRTFGHDPPSSHNDDEISLRKITPHADEQPGPDGRRVIRTIDGFHQDAEGDWVADLVCLHSQHVRHRPPFFDRPWVTSAAGRAERIGTALDCPLCDRAELPADLR